MKIRLKEVSIALIVLAALLPPARRLVALNLVGGIFGILSPHPSASSGGALSGGGLGLQPGAGGPTSAAGPLSGGAFVLNPGPVPSAISPTAAASSLREAHPFPVPFRPSSGHTKITFTGLTHAAVIKVYNLNGELVRSLAKDDSNPTLDWSPVTNAEGERVSSGLYIYHVTDPVSNETKTGKLIIVR